LYRLARAGVEHFFHRSIRIPGVPDGPTTALRCYAHDGFAYPLPAGHRFPLGKYALLRARVEAEPRFEVHDARAATRAELLLAHTPDWVERVERGELTRAEQRALGLPWSPELVERARRSVGATFEATGAALADGAGANLGGGTHHAFPDAGRGFCLFNDVVAATRALRERGRLRRVLVVDLDVHQGDGTQAALAGDDEAFTFALNGRGNYPFRRVPGDLERDLPPGAGDDAYLDALATLLPEAIARARAELCFYLAGADPFAGDRLGRLALTHAGLAGRDRLVRSSLLRAGIPVCVTLAGGYAERIEDTVAINLATLRAFA
jgi:acetoin utilization deacetylase AcuC-like enzyme